jgi:hypothetical protein
MGGGCGQLGQDMTYLVQPMLERRCQGVNGVEGVVHKIKHIALFSSVHHGFSAEVCVIYMHVYTYTHACICIDMQYSFDHWVWGVGVHPGVHHRSRGGGQGGGEAAGQGVYRLQKRITV